MQDNTIPNTSNGANQKQHIRNELPTLENEYATLPRNPTETLSHEQQTNLENLKRIMNSEKTTLPSLRNIEWSTLKIETNKINQILPYISTNNITELNELIYAGAKLVCEKIRVPSKSTKKQSKPGWENRQETKNKIQKEYLRRTRKLHVAKLSNRNLIKRINTLAVSLVRSSGPFLKWTRDELRQMDQRTRKLMTMHKA